MSHYFPRVFLLCCLTMAAMISLPSHAQTNTALPDKPHIVVNGYGFVEAVPDIVTIQFQVAATADDFKSAKQRVDDIVGKAFTAAAKHNIPTEQIHASQISASPQYQWQQQKRIYKGEQVSRQVEIKLTEVERYNDVINALLDTGIQRLSSVQLGFQQQQHLEQQALTKALDHAKLQANTIAQHLGTTIKTAYQIAPQQQPHHIGRMAMSADRATESKSVGLVLSKQKLEQNIRVVYLIR